MSYNPENPGKSKGKGEIIIADPDKFYRHQLETQLAFLS